MISEDRKWKVFLTFLVVLATVVLIGVYLLPGPEERSHAPSTQVYQTLSPEVDAAFKARAASATTTTSTTTIQPTTTQRLTPSTVRAARSSSASPPPPDSTVPVDTSPTTVATTPPPSASSGQTWETVSTAYCLTGNMANGEKAHDGAVAVHTSRYSSLKGTQWKIIAPPENPLIGRVFTVKDNGPGAAFDIAMPGRCHDANQYGRKHIVVEKV